MPNVLVYCRLLALLLLIFCLNTAQSSCFAQSSIAPSSDEKQLVKEQIQTQKEQAKYYQAEVPERNAETTYYTTQTNKLKEKPQPKSLWENIKETPTSVGVLLAALAALFTYLATLRNQRDTQFYEALKRFGDPDSATTRFTAVGLLSQLGQERVLYLFGRKRFPYFTPTFQQLLGGSMLEDNKRVLRQIRIALRSLKSIDERAAVLGFYRVNRTLQDEARVATANFLVANGIRRSNHTSIDIWWKLIAKMSAYPEHIVRHVILQKARGVTFEEHMEIAIHAYDDLPEEAKRQHKSETGKELKIAMERLRTHVQTWSMSLKRPSSRTKRPSSRTQLYHRFVLRQLTPSPRLELQRVFLAKVKMPGAQLQGANLRGAHFGEANLKNSDLRGANFSSVEIRNAQLFGMKIDDETNIDNTEWWTANFYGTPGMYGATLLKELYRRTSSKPQLIPDEVHPSVQDFLAAQNQKPEGVSVLQIEADDAV
jgi:hypothetical protein